MRWCLVLLVAVLAAPQLLCGAVLVNSTQPLEVAATSFVDQTLGLTVSTASTAGVNISVTATDPATFVTTCALPDARETAGVGFVLANVASSGTAFDVVLRANVTWAASVGTRNWVRPYRTLQRCPASGVWESSDAFNCTGLTVAAASSTPYSFLEAGLCGPGNFAVLQQACSEAAGFPRKCNVCLEGWRGCQCSFRSESPYDSSSTTMGLAVTAAALFAMAAAVRASLMREWPDLGDGKGHGGYMVRFGLIVALYLALAFVYLGLVLKESNSRRLDNVEEPGFDALRSVFAIVGAVASIGAFFFLGLMPNSYEVLTPTQLPRWFTYSMLVTCPLLEAFGQLVVLVANGYPVWAAHEHVREHTPDVWQAHFFLSLFFVVFQGALYFFFKAIDSPAWRDAVLSVYLAVGVTVAVLLGTTDLRLPCE